MQEQSGCCRVPVVDDPHHNVGDRRWVLVVSSTMGADLISEFFFLIIIMHHVCLLTQLLLVFVFPGGLMGGWFGFSFNFDDNHHLHPT